MLTLTACGERTECCSNCNCKLATVEEAIVPTEAPEIDFSSYESTEQSEESSNNEASNYEVELLVETDDGNLYDKIKEKYLNTDWDGTPIEFENHTISLSEGGGYIVVDDHMIDNRNENLDLIFLEGFEGIEDYEACYIPKKGTYFIYNKRLIKCKKGAIISVSEYSFDGIIGQYEYELSYFEEIDKLFLVVHEDASSIGKRTLYCFKEYDNMCEKPELLGEYLFQTTYIYAYEDSNGIHYYTDNGIIDCE